MAGILVQLKLLGLLLLVLLEIATNVANVNHVVRFASGINNNDTLRRLWSRPEAVIFYPVQMPIFLSWAFAWGVHAIVRSILVGILQTIDAVNSPDDLSLLSNYAVLLAASISSGMAGMALYVTFAGTAVYYQIIGTVALSLIISIPQVLAGYSTTPGVLALWIIVMVLSTAAMGFWSSQACRNRTSTTIVRELMPDRSKVSPPQTGRGFVIVSCCIVLLLVLRIWDELVVSYIRRKDYGDVYMAEVLRNFSGLMVLIGCSFLSIRLVNTWIGKRPMAWQWWSMLAPGLVLFVGEVVLLLIKSLSGGKEAPPANDEPTTFLKAFLVPVISFVEHIVMYGTAGFLGCAVYLGVLARAAMQALDPGVDGQNELILDDDDSDFDVESP